MPQEPHLLTSARARPSQLKPSWQLEEEAMQAVHQFHAQPLKWVLLWADTGETVTLKTGCAVSR
jgi:hypothetical protein